ncbi:MAG: AAA family ATPase [Campylobacterales bacterium]
MELVYLWVEEYKNIKQQGFNFSPRFRCDYDSDSQKLTIEENRDYVHIFPENINITAIVGKNGSGKSSLLRYIINTMSKSINMLEKEIKLDKALAKNNSVCLIFFENKKQVFYYVSSEAITPVFIDTKKYTFDNFGRKNDYNDLIDDAFSHIYTASSDFSDIDFFMDREKAIYHTKIGDVLYKESFNCRLDSGDTYGLNNYSIDILDYINLCDFSILNFYIKTKGAKNIPYLFELKNIKLTITGKFLQHELKNSVAYFLEPQEEYLFQADDKISRFVQSIVDKKDFEFAYYLYIYLKTKSTYCSNFKNDILPIFKDEQNALSTEKLRSFISNNVRVKYREIHSLISEAQNIYTSRMGEAIADICSDKYHRRLFIELFELNLIGIKDGNEISFKELSSGEKNLILQLSLAYDFLEKETKVGKILLLDEVDMFLHPEWTKSFIYTIVKSLSEFKKYDVQIFIATHSPFLLSDIPKESVIFLDTVDKTTNKYPQIDISNLDNGNCINVTKYIDIKTFGENIHTLLTDAFFMEDGLMGKFARSKIEEILKFCREVKGSGDDIEAYRCIYDDKQKYFWHIQRSIGEKYISKIVENELRDVEQILLDKNEAIDREIKRLEAIKESRK